MVSVWTSRDDEQNFAVDLRLETLLVGEALVMQRLKQAIAAIAPSDAPVLVQGPTGAGKEVVARTLHILSERPGRLVALNCGAIPAELLEAELFGHEKGAFTGAHSRRIGLIEQANGGTLFLDEIGDMPASLQVKLLRVLETRKFQRVGGEAEIEVDFRLVSATHRNLEDEVRKRTFREDLLFRLNVFALWMPPLAARAKDIPLILRYLSLNAKDGKGNAGRPLRFTSDAMQALMDYAWPGNVRELRNVHDRAQVLFRDREITANDVRDHLLSGWIAGRECSAPVPTRETTAPTSDNPFCDGGQIDLRVHLQNIEEQLILSALDETKGSVAKAAARLRIKRTTLIGKMQKLGIDRLDHAA